MARRLKPEERKAEIIQQTRLMIATKGPRGLSLRGVARWCGMSAPGVLHHFDGLGDLLEQVLVQREAEQVAAGQQFVAERGGSMPLIDFLDGMVRHFAERAEETRNFDALEAEAVALPDHPAHEHFTRERPELQEAVYGAARKEYEDPDAVVTLLTVVGDGLRFKWLRADGVPDYWGDYVVVRDTAFNAFQKRRTDRS